MKIKQNIGSKFDAVYTKNNSRVPTHGQFRNPFEVKSAFELTERSALMLCRFKGFGY